MAPDERLGATLADFDAQNAEDLRRVPTAEGERPGELVDAERLTAWVLRLEPGASTALRLAARCQHLRRWEIPRASEPPGRKGYLAWRQRCARHHAEQATLTLERHAWDPETIASVQRIIKKQGLGAGEAQVMEDALCLAFLEHEIDAFAAKHDDERLIAILQKTWRKMSARARDAALALTLSPRVAELLRRALA